MPRVERVYNRGELYALVWSRPMREAAKQYGVSDVALKKVCRKLNVPTPPQGHWLRVAAGRDVVRATLAPLGAKEASVIVVSRWEDHDPIVPSAGAATRAATQKASAGIVVAPTLDAPHRLVARAAKLLTKAKPYDGLVSSRHGGLDISVAPQNVDRACRIMDALLKGLDARSLPVEVTPAGLADRQASATRVRVDDHWIQFALAETVKIAPPPAGPPRKPRHAMSVREYLSTPFQPIERRPRLPTGTLTLTIKDGGRTRHWHDRKHRRLETFLSDFVGHLFIAADWLTQKARLDEEARQRAQENERKRQEEVRRIAEEKKLTDKLRHDLEQWRIVRDLRAYAGEMRAVVAAASMKPTEGGPLHRYLTFILDYAERMDPLRELREKIANATQPT